MTEGEWLDFKMEREAYARQEAARRAAGDFAPYFVRRIGSWGSYTPAAQIYFGRWGVFFENQDLNNVAPDWWRLGTFWRFSKACRVAAGLRTAFQYGATKAECTYPDCQRGRNGTVSR